MKGFFKNKFVLSLTAIIVLAILLRFPYISVYPPSMVQDEVGLGYSAISIAETGKDEWGISYPLVFKSFGDYKPPAFFYVTALLYKIIGWNFALPRITSAIAGIFVVLCGTLWVRKILKSDELGLITGIILAISPWTVHMSRMALESNLGLAFFTTGLLFMADAKKSYLKILLSALFFSLSTNSYHGFRFTVILFLSLLVFSLFFLHLKNIKKFITESKHYFFILILSTLISLPGFLAGGATNRLNQTLTITSGKTAQLYEHKENNCHLSLAKLHPSLTKICRIKYNKFSKPIIIVTSSVINHISPAFLFFSGDTDVGRNPTENGEFFVILFPFWMIGALILLKEYQENLVVLVGYLTSLVPSALSGAPHSIRMSVLIPFAAMVIVIGYKYLKEYFKRIKHFSIVFFSLLFISLGSFSINYLVDTYASHEISGTYLSYAKKAAQLAYEYVQRGYIVYSDHDLYPEPHIYYAYWNRIDPKITQESLGGLYTETAGFERPTQFGEKMHFEEGNIRSLVCNKKYNQPTVFITNDPITLPAQHLIQDNTGSYNIIHVYDLEVIRADKLYWLNYCSS
jgi:4-amino-4-deoxy-L-arabinose transferase-like glycosyltransferase